MPDCAKCGHAQSQHPPYCRDPYIPGTCNHGYDLCGCKEFVYAYKADPLSDPSSAQGANSDAGLSRHNY